VPSCHRGTRYLGGKGRLSVPRRSSRLPTTVDISGRMFRSLSSRASLDEQTRINQPAAGLRLPPHRRRQIQRKSAHPELGQLSHLIWGMVAPCENADRCRSRRAGAAAASGPGLVLPCGVADSRGGLPVTPAHYGIRTRNLAWPPRGRQRGDDTTDHDPDH
jgi:hypothetical protein